VLVNCAGQAGASRVVSGGRPASLEEFRRVIEVNLVGTFNCTRLAAARMVRSSGDEGEERGVIVNTASIAAWEGQPGQAAYAASKAGIVGMTLPVARELARSGIRVVTIAPGLFDTPMLDSVPDEARRSLAASVPFPRRLGRPEEFAAVVAEAIRSQMLNGTTIRLDGALRLHA
jgi:NAD(P)-dependent dehydrogenase (short-subunit alcohol dehydrogenase family)